MFKTVNIKKLMLSVCVFPIAVTAVAQSEVVPDSIPPVSLDGSRYKDFGGFVLDMGPLPVAPPPMIAPQLTYRPYGNNNTIKNYNEIFRPGLNVTYDRGTFSGFSPMYSRTGFGGYGLGFNSMPPTLQSASFKLKNGLRITTYGEYDADGNKVRNPAALPWERNNFNGAFEMKSENGNFGIRIEVQRGRNMPY